MTAFRPLLLFTAFLSALAAPALAQAPRWVAPRTPDGQPDLQGIWTTDDMRRRQLVATLMTTFERFGSHYR